MKNNISEYHLKLLGKSLREVTDPGIFKNILSFVNINFYRTYPMLFLLIAIHAIFHYTLYAT